MSNKTLEGMARAFNSAPEYADVDGMRAALLWLASNVSDEMVSTSFRAGGIQVLSEHPEVIDKRRREISAALRAAAGGGDK